MANKTTLEVLWLHLKCTIKSRIFDLKVFKQKHYLLFSRAVVNECPFYQEFPEIYGFSLNRFEVTRVPREIISDLYSVFSNITSVVQLCKK